MRKSIIVRAVCFMCSAFLVFGVSSCSSDDGGEPHVEPARQTVLMFFPWSTNLKTAFQRNVDDFSKVLVRRGLKGERVVVCMATSANTASLYELTVNNGKCVADTLLRYRNRSFTSAASMASMFQDVKIIAPAEKYGMIVGCHGLSWLPVDNTPKSRRLKRHYDVTSGLQTRYFGGLTADSEIETAALAEALSEAGMKMEYILFDVCYMSSIEVAYELKDVTRYIIGSPTEVMSYGFPYGKCGEYLLGDVDYKNVADNFISYYNLSSSPFATVAVTDCSQLDALAAIVKQINNGVGERQVSLDEVQPMDGYRPTLFFDFADYIRLKCADAALLDAFNRQLDLVVPYKGNTARYYSTMRGEVSINRYSGLNTSESSQNALYRGYENTAWYKATH